MILTCPNCGTQYVVKDGAIPPQGRQVRCASCKHSWHQDPEAAGEMILGPEAEAPEPVEEESIAEAAMIDPNTGPEAEERAYEESLVEGPAPEDPVAEAVAGEAYAPVDVTAGFSADYDAPPVAEPQPDDDFSPFAERDYAEPRRRSPVLAIFIVLVLIAAAAAAFWFFAPPEWKHRLGLSDGTTPLTLVTTHMDRQKLASGNELLTITGRVVNPTTASHSVPPIYARLKTKTGRVIYSWTIAPPAPTLAPGASASFNSAEIIRSGGDELTISLDNPRA